jgi:hypothetical protein
MDDTEGPEARGGMSLNVDRQAVKRSATAIHSTALSRGEGRGLRGEVAERALLRRRVCRKRLFDGSHARQQRQQRHRGQGGLRDVAIVGWRVLWAERRRPSLFVLSRTRPDRLYDRPASEVVWSLFDSRILIPRFPLPNPNP